jgi:hypothetical protein
MITVMLHYRAAGNLPELVVRSAQKLLMIEKSLDQEVSKAGKSIVLVP